MTDYPIRFPTDDVTGAHFCPRCGEPECDVSVEAFEAFDEIVCPDCAAEMFEDAETLTLANSLEPGFRRLG